MFEKKNIVNVRDCLGLTFPAPLTTIENKNKYRTANPT